MTAKKVSIPERRTEEKAIHVLVVCGSAAAIKKSFKRKDEPVRFDQADTSACALEMIMMQADVRPFDCVIMDIRDEESFNPLNVVAIAAMRAFSKLVVICGDEHSETLQAMTGIDLVLSEDAKPGDIIKAIMSASPSKLKDQEELIKIPKSESSKDGYSDPSVTEDKVVAKKGRAKKGRPASKLASKPKKNAPSAKVRDDIPVKPSDPITDSKSEQAEAVEKSAGSPVTQGFESSLSLIAEADQQVWQRFVPVANFLYKKLAIVILTALFLTFVTYGAMIVFFMGSSGWALPFELSRGHALVQKVERDLSSMRLRENQLRQDINFAQANAAKASRDKRDGQLQLTLVKRTLEEETVLQSNQRLEIENHIARLKVVIGDFNRLNKDMGFAKELEDAFSKRLITKKSFKTGALALLETMHRIAGVKNEVSQKQHELAKVDRRLEFLRTLLAEIDKPEVRVITSAGSDLSHLAREVITSKNLISKSEQDLKSTEVSIARLSNSLQVIRSNRASLEKTPAARALTAPVVVLFVPYTNTERVQKGEQLFSCHFSIVVCSPIGRVGDEVQGETTAVHPLFGKPLRGTFVEAEFFDPKSVTAELVHAGGAPLFF